MCDELKSVLLVRNANQMPIRSAVKIARQTSAPAFTVPSSSGAYSSSSSLLAPAYAHSAPPPEDAASSIGEDADIGSSASLAGAEGMDGDGPPMHELLVIAGTDFRDVSCTSTEAEAVEKIRALVDAEPALKLAEPGCTSMVSEALLHACNRGSTKIAAHLLSLGADRNAVYEENHWTPLICALYEPSFQSSVILAKLLLNGHGPRVNVWSADRLKGFTALDYVREYQDLAHTLGDLGFMGEDISEYRQYLADLPAGEKLLTPQAWRREFPLPPGEHSKIPPAEPLAVAAEALAQVARYLACPAAVFEGVAPGRCKAAFDAYVAQGAAAEAAAEAEARAVAQREQEGAQRAAAEAVQREAARKAQRAQEQQEAAAAMAAALLAARAEAEAETAAAAPQPFLGSISSAALASTASLFSSPVSSFNAHYLANTLVCAAFLGLLLMSFLQGTRLVDISGKPYY